MVRTTISLAAVALALTPAIGAAKTGRPKAAAFLAVSMQPGTIARTLVGVQDEWKAQVALFASCDHVANSTSADDSDLLLVDCRGAPNAFAKSCQTVVQAVTKGSNGDRDVVEEYMKDVCSQEVLKGWRQTRCQLLASKIYSAMSLDTYSNRAGQQGNKICADMWSTFLGEEESQHESERKLAAAKAAEEAKSKAEAKAKADEEAKQRAEDEAKAEAEAAEVAKQRKQAKAKEAAVKAKTEAKAKANEDPVVKAKAWAAKLVREGDKGSAPIVNASAAKHTVKFSAKVEAKAKANEDPVAKARAWAAKLASEGDKGSKPIVNASAKHTAKVSANRTVNTTAPKNAKQTANKPAPKTAK